MLGDDNYGYCYGERARWLARVKELQNGTGPEGQAASACAQVRAGNQDQPGPAPQAGVEPEVVIEVEVDLVSFIAAA